MKILCTFPGKFGDLIWALPTVRAIAEVVGEPVDLVIAGAYGSIVPLIQRQSYIGQAFADSQWVVQNTAPMTPRMPERVIAHEYDQVFHLGYRGWPKTDLPRETWACFAAQAVGDPEFLGRAVVHFSLDRPWIIATHTVNQADWARAYAVGFTDEHFELKYGLTELLRMRWVDETCGQRGSVNLSTSPRWNAEAAAPWEGWSWESAAAWLANTPVFLGCNSALHVLARALGVPVVMMEPNPHRHNDIFYPYGKSGKGVELVLGNDGLPTFDARAVWETLCKVLAESSAGPGAGSGGTTILSSSATPPQDCGSSAPAADTAPTDGSGTAGSEPLWKTLRPADNWQGW